MEWGEIKRAASSAVPGMFRQIKREIFWIKKKKKALRVTLSENKHENREETALEKSDCTSCKGFSESNKEMNQNEWGGVWTCVTHSEPAAMSRYEVSAVSTPTGTTMLMTFSADQFLSYWVQRMGVQNTEACQPQQSLQTSKCIHKAWPRRRGRGKRRQEEGKKALKHVWIQWWHWTKHFTCGEECQWKQGISIWGNVWFILSENSNVISLLRMWSIEVSNRWNLD